MAKREQLGFMTAPPLRMLCCHVRRQQLIEMEEHGLVHVPLSCFYLPVLLWGWGWGGGAAGFIPASRCAPVHLLSSSINLFIVVVPPPKDGLAVAHGWLGLLRGA